MKTEATPPLSPRPTFNAGLLAAKHHSTRVSYTGLLGQCQRSLRNRGESGHAEMLRQLQEHLQELGRRWYSGDTAVVDEMLQLYCVEPEARVALLERLAIESAVAKPAAEPAAESGWWRKRADEIELKVAQGESDAMRCYTDMRALLQAATEPAAGPFDMVLYCPQCGTQHIDAPEHGSDRVDPYPSSTGGDDPALSWSNPPHRSHLCHSCGHVWRPADVPTNGVPAVKTKGKADSIIVTPHQSFVVSQLAAQPTRAAADALQGLAAYLRVEAGGVTGEAEKTLRQWASAVDALAAAPARVRTVGEEEARYKAWYDSPEGRAAVLQNNPRVRDRAVWLAAIAAAPGPVLAGRYAPDVDELAQFIRATDGTHTMGAGALAERIVGWLSERAALAAAPQPAAPTDEEIEDFLASRMTPEGRVPFIKTIREALATWATAPQPATPTVPARWVSELCGGEFDYMTAGQGYRKGWNDCRDAMLAAAPAAVERQPLTDEQITAMLEEGTCIHGKGFQCVTCWPHPAAPSDIIGSSKEGGTGSTGSTAS